MTPTMDKLSDVLRYWCAKENLPYESADELALHPECTPAQRKWLYAYCTVWEGVVE
jgi:hypothetical protein